MSCNDPVLRQTGIRIDMPRDKEQAQLLLMMSSESNTDSLQRVHYINDFISLYPKEVDGYVARAQNLMAANNYDGAQREMASALKNVENKADAHAEWARMMYQKLMLAPDTTFTKWTLDDAMAEIQKAYAIDPQPAYRHREAQIFSQRPIMQRLMICLLNWQMARCAMPRCFMKQLSVKHS